MFFMVRIRFGNDLAETDLMILARRFLSAGLGSTVGLTVTLLTLLLID